MHAALKTGEEQEGQATPRVMASPWLVPDLEFDARYKGLRPATSFHAPPAQSWALAQAWASAPPDLDGKLEGARKQRVHPPNLYSQLDYGFQVCSHALGPIFRAGSPNWSVLRWAILS